MEKKFKITNVFPEKKGTGPFGEWVLQEIIVEEIDNTVENPNQLLLTLRKKVLETITPKVGMEVKIAYSTKVKTIKFKKDTPEEFTKYEQEINCWKMEEAKEVEKEEDPLPFM